MVTLYVVRKCCGSERKSYCVWITGMTGCLLWLAEYTLLLYSIGFHNHLYHYRHGVLVIEQR